MNKIALILLTLFSFLHEEVYLVDEYKCINNEIKVQYEEHWYDVQLFNILLKEDVDICGYMEGDISIAFDSHVPIENPLTVYLFVDQKLLQQTLVDEGQAVVKINHPKYKYSLVKKEKAVMKEVKDVNVSTTTMSNSKKIAFVLIGIWAIILMFIAYKRYRKKHVQEKIEIKEKE